MLGRAVGAEDVVQDVWLRWQSADRSVVADPHARYFGAELGERTLVPWTEARLGQTRFQDWLKQPAH